MAAQATTIDLRSVDKSLVTRGLRRCPLPQFLAWLAPWVGVLALAAYAFYLCVFQGLYHTNMDNRFAFGLWIFLDLTIIAFGAGAFFTGFLLYVLRKRELNAVINSAVVIGFICYSGAGAVLGMDVGQPLRVWFTFWHPNVHSMLTEVTFCITCYLTVLLIEYVPVILKNRKMRQIPSFLVFEWELHKLIPVLAALGTFLSFFHQGSLGGLYGVLKGRPFAFREGFAIWPSTFFLFILSAAAVGPSFILLTSSLVSKMSRKELVSHEVYCLLARISGGLLTVYVALKSIDTLIWINRTSPGSGISAASYYAWEPFGSWVLFSEIVIFGLIPAMILLRATKRSWLIASALFACGGIALNRLVINIQTLAVPTLPFDSFLTYGPSWEETAAFLGVIAYGVIVYSCSFRYLNLFPQEKELSEKYYVS